MPEPYRKQKGANFERFIAQELTELFKEWGFKFYRSPSQERWKTRSGDVNLLERTDPEGICIMRRYHLEVEHKKNPRYLQKLEKAIDDGNRAGREAAIYIGKKTGYEPFVMMSWKDFKKILLELQGFIKETHDKFC